MTRMRITLRQVAPIALLAMSIMACGEGTSESEDAGGVDAADNGAPSAVTEQGPVKATVELAPPAPRLGDALTLTLTVEAEAEVTVDMPAFGEALGRFSIVDFTPRQRTEADGRTVASQRYTLQAPMSGKQRIPPLRIEFLDERPGQTPPDGPEEYRELLTDELAVTIASVLPEGTVTDELRPVRPALKELGTAGRWIAIGSALAVVAGLLALSFFLWRLSQKRVRVTAYDRALGRITALERRGFPAPGEADAWYVELSDIVRHYLEDRYGVRAPELTTEEFLQEARRSGELSRAHRDLLSRFLEQCDQVKFAAYHPEQAESKEALATSRRFLDETRILPEQSDLAEERPAA